MIKISKNEQLIQTLFSGKKGKKYFGKHVAVVAGKALLLPSDPNKATELLDNLENKYHETPELVFVPQPETYLPRSYATYLGIDLTADCLAQTTHGIGGIETVYVFKNLILKIGDFKRKIPVGFLDRDDVPPLFGRHECLETFRTILDKQIITLIS